MENQLKAFIFLLNQINTYNLEKKLKIQTHWMTKIFEHFCVLWFCYLFSDLKFLKKYRDESKFLKKK